jgi:S-adenosylmethionine/arginine decarboxylase-like enzyme
LTGKTILISLRDGWYAPLASEDRIRAYLSDAVTLCGQNIAGHTVECLQVKGEGDKDGITEWQTLGQVILLQSHFFIHTWPLKAFARIEMSTCCPPVWNTIDDFIHMTKRFFGGTTDFKVIDW